MEQNLAPYDLEYMKMAMLKHEEIFKQQVYELHRLYRVQKLLMRAPQQKNYKNDHLRVPNEKKRMKNLLLDLERPRMLDHSDQDDDAIDLTLALGNCYNSQRNDDKKASATRLVTSDSVMSFSSSSTGSSTLSKKPCAGAGRNDVDYPEQFRQQDRAMVEQPPWHLQVFSLNMT